MIQSSEARAEWQGWLAFVAALLAYVALAWRAVHIIGRVDWEALASTARAYEATHATGSLNLSLMGFGDPPLPVLLQVPLVYLNPAWATQGLAASLVSAIAGALAVLVVWKLLREAGLGYAATWALLVLLGANPVWLAACTTGSKMALVGLFAAVAGLAMIRWVRDGTLRDLVVLALAASAAPMAAFEAVGLPVAAAAVVLAILARRRRGAGEVEGTLVTLLLPVAYVAGLWLFTSWIILGDALYFAHQMSHPALAWRLSLVLLGLCAGLLACSWLAARPRLPRGLVGLVCVAALATLVGAGTSAEPGQPRLAHGYGFLRSTVGAGDARTVEHVAKMALASTDGKRVLVDSPLDFAVRLLSGQPERFVRAAEFRRAVSADQRPLDVVSYVLTEGGLPGAELNVLLAGHALVPVWQEGGWRLYEILPAGAGLEEDPGHSSASGRHVGVGGEYTP
ncbi:MAG: hypothetical protein ACE5R4_07060 [Armatimonadota bacterium]